MWSDLFDYDGSNLIWKHRERISFKTKSAWANTNARFEGRLAGRKNCSGGSVVYIQVRVKGNIYLAHRIIWEMTFGKIPTGLFIDHIDGNGLNNKICNMRLASKNQNTKNLPRSCANKSGQVGVYFMKSCNKWAANIGVSGVQKYLGVFDCYEDACRKRKYEENKAGYDENHGREKFYGI